MILYILSLQQARKSQLVLRSETLPKVSELLRYILSNYLMAQHKSQDLGLQMDLLTQNINPL